MGILHSRLETLKSNYSLTMYWLNVVLEILSVSRYCDGYNAELSIPPWVKVWCPLWYSPKGIEKKINSRSINKFIDLTIKLNLYESRFDLYRYLPFNLILFVPVTVENLGSRDRCFQIIFISAVGSNLKGSETILQMIFSNYLAHLCFDSWTFCESESMIFIN